MFFKKKSFKHDLFGELRYFDGQWTGSIKFPPLNGEEISIYLVGEIEEFVPNHMAIWRDINENYEGIVEKVVKKVIEYTENIEDSFLVLKEDFSPKDIFVEAVFIDFDLSVTLHWGVIPKNASEAEIEVSTSYLGKTITVLGIAD